MDRVFLDASVLFAAGHRARTSLERLWSLPGVTLLTSKGAAERALRNLDSEERRSRLVQLLARVDIRPDPGSGELPATALGDAERRVLGAATAARATHLLTGDTAGFGAAIGKAIGGVVVLRPSSYLS